MYSFCNLLILFCCDYFICEFKIYLESKLGFGSRLFFVGKRPFFFALRFVTHTSPPMSQWLITCFCSRPVILNFFLVAAHFQRFQNLAAHIEKDKFKNYLLTYNTLCKVVYDNNFKYAK